jgi:hypothetical protein
MRESSVAAYWIRMYGVVGSILVKLTLLFHKAAILFSYIIQRITLPKFCIFRISVTIHHRMALLKMALVLVPPQKLALHVWL